MGRLGILRREMAEMRKKGHKWQEIGDAYGVTVGLAWRIVNEGYEPKTKALRAKLGLGRKRKPGRLGDLPVEELRKMLEERVEV